MKEKLKKKKKKIKKKKKKNKKSWKKNFYQKKILKNFLNFNNKKK